MLSFFQNLFFFANENQFYYVNRSSTVPIGAAGEKNLKFTPFLAIFEAIFLLFSSTGGGIPLIPPPPGYATAGRQPQAP